MPVTIAQITDTHLVPYASSHLQGFPTKDSLATVLAEVKTLAPDYLLLTGDLADAGEQSAYEELIDLITPLAIPSLWLDGNHDLLDKMEEMLDLPPFNNQKSTELGGWRLILLSSVIKDRCTAEGELSDRSLEWLKTELLKYPNQPTLIALHHPPVPTDVKWLDPMGLQSPEKFHEAIASFSQVRLVLFGHIHHNLHRHLGGVDYYGCPSTCVQFAPANIEPTNIEELKLPGFRWLSLFPDGTYQTHIQRVDFASDHLKLVAY